MPRKQIKRKADVLGDAAATCEIEDEITVRSAERGSRRGNLVADSDSDGEEAPAAVQVAIVVSVCAL